MESGKPTSVDKMSPVWIPLAVFVGGRREEVAWVILLMLQLSTRGPEGVGLPGRRRPVESEVVVMVEDVFVVSINSYI